MKEQNTNYAYKLKYLDNPTFDKVRDLAAQFMYELPRQQQNELYEALNRGVDILDSEPQMVTYLYSFGKMHQAKLQYAFDKLPSEFLQQDEINIIDYGCGQALGTMCYADFLHKNGYSQKVKNITLIEPSEMCLKRAALHVSVFFPDAEIKTVCKLFDDLQAEDICCEDDIPTLHILSNVLDILDFDLNTFSNLLNECLNGYNQFVCVGPYYGFSENDIRMEEFCTQLQGNTTFYKSLNKYKLQLDKTWTARILCFSVGEFNENFSTEVTDEDIKNGVEDEYGVVYSRDRRRLLTRRNKKIETYSIKEGTKVICRHAFAIEQWDRPLLRRITIPNSVVSIGDCAFIQNELLEQIIIPKSIRNIGVNPFWGCYKLEIKCHSSHFIEDNGLIIDLHTHTLISCISRENIITIPQYVRIIGDGAFSGCYHLKVIILNNSIISIGKWAFSDCSLVRITLPNSITRIGEYAFQHCTSLKYIDIPDSVRVIEAGAFQNCYSLEQIRLSYSLSIIEHEIFDNCSALKQMLIPESVSIIKDCAFRCCHSLEHITIINPATHIGSGAFIDCNSIKKMKIHIPKDCSELFRGKLDIDDWDKLIEEKKVVLELDKTFDINTSSTKVSLKEINNGIEDEFGIIYSKDGKKLLTCNSTKYERILIIKTGTKIICDRAFQNYNDNYYNANNRFQHIIIPNTITNIGDFAFECCDDLSEITIPNSVTSIGDFAFHCCFSLCNITIPASTKHIGINPFSHCNLTIDSLSSRYIVQNDLLIDIKEKILIACISKNNNVVIPDFIEVIGDEAFSWCESLESIIIPNSVIRIGDRAFYYCHSLKLLTISNTVKSIGNNPFARCDQLKIDNFSSRFIIQNGLLIDTTEKKLIACLHYNNIITISNSVNIIGTLSFSHCKTIIDITIPNTVTDIEYEAFTWCESLQVIIIPNSVKNIGESAFSHCESLRMISFPNSIKQIGHNAFDGCNRIQDIFIPKGTTEKFKSMLDENLWNKLVEQ